MLEVYRSSPGRRAYRHQLPYCRNPETAWWRLIDEISISLYRELAREGDLSAIVFHRFWSPLHEITPPQQRLPRGSARSADVCLRRCSISSSCPRVGSLQPLSRPCPCARDPRPPAFTTPPNFYTSVSLHSICIGPASAASGASF